MELALKFLCLCVRPSTMVRRWFDKLLTTLMQEALSILCHLPQAFHNSPLAPDSYRDRALPSALRSMPFAAGILQFALRP